MCIWNSVSFERVPSMEVQLIYHWVWCKGSLQIHYTSTVIHCPRNMLVACSCMPTHWKVTQSWLAGGDGWTNGWMDRQRRSDPHVVSSCNFSDSHKGVLRRKTVWSCKWKFYFDGLLQQVTQGKKTWDSNTKNTGK